MMMTNNNQVLSRDEMTVDDYSEQADFHTTTTSKNNNFAKILLGSLIGGTLGAIATALAQPGTAERLNETVRKVGNSVKNAAAGVNDTVKGVGNAVQAVATGVNETVQDVGDTVKDTVEDVNDTFKNTINAVKGTADNVNETVKTTANTVKTAAADITQSTSTQTPKASPYQMAYIIPVEDMENISGNPGIGE